jgi:hypothetical protein
MAEAPKDRARIRPDLLEFVAGYRPERGLNLEVAVKEDGRIVVFHSLRFTKDVAWFEFEPVSRRLSFVMEEGEVPEIGLPLSPDVARHVVKARRILMVLMDPESKAPIEGFYIPLIIAQP